MINPNHRCFLLGFPPGSKSVALQLGVHLILLYFIKISPNYKRNRSKSKSQKTKVVKKIETAFNFVKEIPCKCIRNRKKICMKL